jgi:hypothetical protein
MKRNQASSKIILVAAMLLVALVVSIFVWNNGKTEAPGAPNNTINSFADCVAAGNPVMESYPEQCAANGKTYTNPDQQIPAQN